ncbi:MAG: DUF4870 family protein [Steroidobacteraceae bacterium]
MSSVFPAPPGMGSPEHESLVVYTHVIYGLHALSALIGITSAATVVGSFLFGLPSIVAVIMNYARRSAVRGTVLESHFRWQIRTFWFGLLFSCIVVAVSMPLMLVLIGFVTLTVGIGIVGLWLIYRIVRGWLALRERRAMYA